MTTVSVSHLSKVYRMYARPWDRLVELIAHTQRHTDFFALNDVSFSLPQGQSLGVVGDNGSGKSTLLQIIAGVLTPTTGSVQCEGTVLGLLELGVGFHHEFTGRQNIFLYGDVLGLSRALIAQRLEQIIDFAELGMFIDQPLKTYSTGMRMRLAFSLIAALDPQVLIVDEALTVGDSYFQKKCLDHITKIKESGRTIIFCSHNTYQVGLFCEEALWLQQGKVRMYGETLPVIAAYDAYQLQKTAPAQLHTSPDRHASAPVRVMTVEWLNVLPAHRGDTLQLLIRTHTLSEELVPFHVMVSLKFSADFGVYATGTHLTGKPPLMGRAHEIMITFPHVPLMGGHYWVHVRLFDDQGMVLYHDKILTDPELVVHRDTNERGVCYLENQWDVRVLDQLRQEDENITHQGLT